VLEVIKTDIKTCPQQIRHQQLQLLSIRAQRLKDMIDTVVCKFKTAYRGLLEDKMETQRRTMNEHLFQTQNYEDRYEESANRAVQFLLFIKTSRVSQINNISSQILNILTEIRMAIGKRQVRMNEKVKEISAPVKRMSIRVTGVSGVLHISLLTSDYAWVFDNKFILIDKAGGTIHRVPNRIPLKTVGPHTVSNSGELIHIDRKYNIKKLSVDNKTFTTLIERSSQWLPYCVYCSPVTGYLMVGMYNYRRKTGKVSVFNSTGQLILTIQNDNTGSMLYRYPNYITENKNSDIIVSDWRRCAVVVTDCEGQHRFSYMGPSESPLNPRGICTDALSHILVCDYNTNTVQMIDKDGHFLSLLLTPQHGISTPFSLNYDDKTHLLWVGSVDTNTVSVYRYIQRKYCLNGKYYSLWDVLLQIVSFV
jgi:DNA-binding beta-propeller fold protein YncE